MVPDAITFSTCTNFLFLSNLCALKKKWIKNSWHQEFYSRLAYKVQWSEYQVGRYLRQVKASTYLVTTVSTINCVSLAYSLDAKQCKAWVFNEWLIFTNRAHCVHTVYLVLPVKKQSLKGTDIMSSEAHMKGKCFLTWVYSMTTWLR